MAEEEKKSGFDSVLADALEHRNQTNKAPFMKDKTAYSNLYAYVQIYRYVVEKEKMGDKSPDLVHQYMIDHAKDLHLPSDIANHLELTNMLLYAMQYTTKANEFPSVDNIKHAYEQYLIDNNKKRKEATDKKEDAEKEIKKQREAVTENRKKQVKYGLLRGFPVAIGVVFAGAVVAGVGALTGGALAGVAAASIPGIIATAGGALGATLSFRGLHKWFKGLSEKRKEAVKAKKDAQKAIKEKEKELKKKLIPGLEKASGKFEKDAKVTLEDIKFPQNQEAVAVESPAMTKQSTSDFSSTMGKTPARHAAASAFAGTGPSATNATFGPAPRSANVSPVQRATDVNPAVPVAEGANVQSEVLSKAMASSDALMNTKYRDLGNPEKVAKVSREIKEATSAFEAIARSGSPEEKMMASAQKGEIAIKMGEIAHACTNAYPSAGAEEVKKSIKEYFDALDIWEKNSFCNEIIEHDKTADATNKFQNTLENVLGTKFDAVQSAANEMAMNEVAEEAPVLEAVPENVAEPEVVVEPAIVTETEEIVAEPVIVAEPEVVAEPVIVENTPQESDNGMFKILEPSLFEFDEIQTMFENEQKAILSDMNNALMMLDPEDQAVELQKVDARIKNLQEVYNTTITSQKGNEAKILGNNFDNFTYGELAPKLAEIEENQNDEQVKAAVELYLKVKDDPKVFDQECDKELERLKKANISTMQIREGIAELEKSAVLGMVRDEMNRKFEIIERDESGKIQSVQRTPELDAINDKWSKFKTEVERVRRGLDKVNLVFEVEEPQAVIDPQVKEEKATKPLTAKAGGAGVPVDPPKPPEDDDEEDKKKPKEVKPKARKKQDDIEFAEDLAKVSEEMKKIKTAYGKTVSELAEDIIVVNGVEINKLEYYLACAEAYSETHDLKGAAKEQEYAQIVEKATGIKGAIRENYYITGNNGRKRRTEFGAFLEAIRNVQKDRIEKENPNIDLADKSREKQERTAVFAKRLREGVQEAEKNAEVTVVDFIDYVSQIGEDSLDAKRKAEQKKLEEEKKKKEQEEAGERQS